MEGLYPIRAVAKLTGLSIDTLRAWERRYSAVTPGRSERGRQYTDNQIQRLLLLRELVERGHAIGQIAPLSEAGLRQLLGMPQGSGSKPPEPAGALVDPLIEAFENFEDARANEELGRLAALLSPRDLVYRVVLPLMREVGDRWHRGKMGIAQEHLVSSALRNLLGSMLRLYPAQRGGPKMLIAALSGEFHEFGLLAAAMIASQAGMNAVLLGANLPAAELAYAARKTGAEIVLVGYSGTLKSAASELEQLAGWLPQGTELWVGGHGIPDLAQSGPGAGIVVFPDMEAFENQCRKRGVMLQ